MMPEWESHCSELAVAAADQASGRDIWRELGGCPRSWREAAALYRRLGVRSLADAATKVFGPPISPLKAMRGDVVMVDGALGICRGDKAEFLDGVHSMALATAAWRVNDG